MILDLQKIDKLSVVIPGTLEKLIVSGSRAYGLESENSDYDLLGIHFMPADEVLEHPEFRTSPDVIRAQFDLDCDPVYHRRSEVSLDSFEWWKFITLWLKGSFVAYELLYGTNLFDVARKELYDLLYFMKHNSSNRIGRAAYGQAKHDWGRRRTDRKKCAMAYFRLLQALVFLRTGKFTVKVDELKKWYSGNYKPLVGLEMILDGYQEDRKNIPVNQEELTLATLEISDLMTQVDKSLISTTLPDRVEKSVLKKVLQDSKSIRMSLIENKEKEI